jgi:hypothetical protein
MDQGRKQLKFKRSLGEQEISDLFSDELSDFPSDTSSDSDTDSGSDSGNKELWPQAVKVKVAPTKTRVVTLRGQPHGEK